MWFTHEASRFLNNIGDIFRWVADRAVKIPVIRDWLANYFYDAATHFYHLSIDMAELDRWVDDIASRVINFLSWDQIVSRISASWYWFSDPVVALWWQIKNSIIRDWYWMADPIGYLWSLFRDRIFNAHSWLWDPVTSLWDSFRSKILGSWSWLNTIDDKIRDVAIPHIRSTWGFLDTIDDKIKIIGWDFTRDKLFDFLELSAASVARIGYRILNYIWNLEWDEEKDEVK